MHDPAYDQHEFLKLIIRSAQKRQAALIAQRPAGYVAGYIGPRVAEVKIPKGAAGS